MSPTGSTVHGPHSHTGAEGVHTHPARRGQERKSRLFRVCPLGSGAVCLQDGGQQPGDGSVAGSDAEREHGAASLPEG